jgi:hypothetical protein
MNDIEVVDIEKHPRIKEKYDPKGEGKYFFLTKDTYDLKTIESEGSIQKIIERIEYENKIRICKQ